MLVMGDRPAGRDFSREHGVTTPGSSDERDSVLAIEIEIETLKIAIP